MVFFQVLKNLNRLNYCVFSNQIFHGFLSVLMSAPDGTKDLPLH